MKENRAKTAKIQAKTGLNPVSLQACARRRLYRRSADHLNQAKRIAYHIGRKQRSSGSGQGREGRCWLDLGRSRRSSRTRRTRAVRSMTLLSPKTALARMSLPQGAPPPKIVLPAVLDRDFGSGHQGVAIKAAPLEWPDISDIAAEPEENGLILVLDQITDPHNVGAMLRLCSAFGAKALVMQTRKAPPLAGATAKVAVGCVETIPSVPWSPISPIRCKVLAARKLDDNGFGRCKPDIELSRGPIRRG